MQDRFPEAAVRHYNDGLILHQRNRYDNAMCHYAFSSECAIKVFRKQFEQIYHVNSQTLHNVEPTLSDMVQFHELLGILDSRLSLLIGTEVPPSVLFKKHPNRRYRNDINYTDNELAACEMFANRLVRQIVIAAIDGRLVYESERGAL